MTASRTARERVRAELTKEITDIARRQLATEGAGGLSLRAVAREMGMVSSAIYRYFPSRDDLLTALIIDSYNALGEAVERAEATVPRDDHLARWLAACGAVRDWGVAHPHEYALIYGSPVPGYQAP
ncbi:TetR/AcrR family transcriptional regulator, partial [Nonomuraea sp. NPDC004297]